MFLVMMYYVSGAPGICVVANTKEKAQEYIDKQMEGMVYSGYGYYVIKEVLLYE